ncbi:MAG: hypothetical protein AAF502_14015 [Bacteroidota bacterium]
MKTIKQILIMVFVVALSTTAFGQKSKTETKKKTTTSIVDGQEKPAKKEQPSTSLTKPGKTKTPVSRKDNLEGDPKKPAGPILTEPVTGSKKPPKGKETLIGKSHEKPGKPAKPGKGHEKPGVSVDKPGKGIEKPTKPAKPTKVEKPAKLSGKVSLDEAKTRTKGKINNAELAISNSDDAVSRNKAKIEAARNRFEAAKKSGALSKEEVSRKEAALLKAERRIKEMETLINAERSRVQKVKNSIE